MPPAETMIQTRLRGRAEASELLAVTVLLAVVGMVFWPGFFADWVRDDLNLVAFSRLLGSPWSLFVQDHFHVPGAHFRPLAYLTLWLDQAWFGNGYLSYSVTEFVLHAGSALLLYRLICLTDMSRALATLCALAFAVHPAVISAALWSSDRGGHLAAFFTLLAVLAAFEYRDRGSWQSLAMVLTASFAAMMAKELGVVVVLPITGLWMVAAVRGRTPQWRALLGLWAVVPIYFLWRWMVLGTAASSMTGSTPVAEILLSGLGVWLADFPGYLFFWERLGSREHAWLIGCALLLLGTLSYLGRHIRATDLSWRRVEILWVGLSLAACSGLLQAPIAALNLQPATGDISAVEVAMQARLYYLPIAGIVLAGSVLVAMAEAAGLRDVRRPMLPVALGLLVLFFAIVARHGAEAYRMRSVDIARVPRAAVTALDGYTLPKQHCLIVYQGVPRAPEWDIYASMDSVVKTVSTDLARVGHCLIYADYPTYYHFLPAGTTGKDGTRPFEILRLEGRLLPPRRVGDLEIAYLTAPAALVGSDFADALVLAYEGGRFVDVTADVIAGRRSIDVR